VQQAAAVILKTCKLQVATKC